MFVLFNFKIGSKAPNFYKLMKHRKSFWPHYNFDQNIHQFYVSALDKRPTESESKETRGLPQISRDCPEMRKTSGHNETTPSLTDNANENRSADGIKINLKLDIKFILKRPQVSPSGNWPAVRFSCNSQNKKLLNSAVFKNRKGSLMDSLKNEVQQLISSKKIQCLFQKAFDGNALYSQNEPVSTRNGRKRQSNPELENQMKNLGEKLPKSLAEGIGNFSTNFNSKLISSLYQKSKNSIIENSFQLKSNQMENQENQMKTLHQNQRTNSWEMQNLEIVNNYVNCRISSKIEEAPESKTKDKLISGHIRYPKKEETKETHSNTQANSQNDQNAKATTPSVVDVLKGESRFGRRQKAPGSNLKPTAEMDYWKKETISANRIWKSRNFY